MSRQLPPAAGAGAEVCIARTKSRAGPGTFGFSEGALTGIGILELVCVAVFAIPKTRVLGAGLLTGYLGGAVATEVRVAGPFIPALVLGALVWLGLYLRDPKVRAVSPI